MAGHSLELQLRETALTRSPCHCAQVHVAWLLKTTSLQEGDFWEERELDGVHPPG